MKEIALENVSPAIRIAEMKQRLEAEIDNGVKMGLSGIVLEGLLNGLLVKVKDIETREIAGGYQEIIINLKKGDDNAE